MSMICAHRPFPVDIRESATAYRVADWLESFGNDPRIKAKIPRPGRRRSRRGKKRYPY